MVTINHYKEFLEQKGIRYKVEGNLPPDRPTIEKHFNAVGHYGLFSTLCEWDKTPEGLKFWSDIDREWCAVCNKVSL